jgi:hypothetical protein
VVKVFPKSRHSRPCRNDSLEANNFKQLFHQSLNASIGEKMNSKSLLPQIFVAVIGLLLLGLAGTVWSPLAGADAPPSAPLATIGDAITYQGYVTDENDEPLDGTFTMRFQIYNAANGGTLRWDSGNANVLVINGLFETRLAITTDIFNGEELWVAQSIGGELLTPRQEILPAPLAHTLRPGAIIKGTANAISNNYLLEVDMNNNTFAFNRGAITGKTTTGNAIYGRAENGRAVYGQTENGYAVYGFDGGSNANQGYGGYFYSTNGIGVYGYSGANRTHPNILAPGIYGQSNQGVGVYGRGDTSNSYSFYNEGGYFEGGKGLYARGTDPTGEQGYGARIFSNQYRGMYVQGASGWFDAYFGGDSGISALSYTDRIAATKSLVVNLGSTTIEPGDLVAIFGVTPSPENGQPMLAVAKADATNWQAVIGVAVEAVSAETISMEDGKEYIDFAPTTGTIAPDGYLVIITSGLAPTVNVSGLALGNDWQIGSKLAFSANGELALSINEVEGIVVGKVAGAVDEANGTIPLFIDID